MPGVADRRGTNAEGLLGIFYVLDYGATGDGQHDDAGGIQAAINAAGVAGGGLVAIPPGVYRLSRALAWGTAANVTIWQHSGVTFTGPGSLPAAVGSNAIRVEPSGSTVGGVPTNSAEGDVAAAGGTGTAADVGHVHGREAFGGAAVVQAFGDAAAPGAAATPSRSDHRHGIPSPVNQLVNGECAINQRGVTAGTWSQNVGFPPGGIVGIDAWRGYAVGTGGFTGTLTQDTVAADLPAGFAAAIAWGAGAVANGVANPIGVAQKLEHVTRLRGRPGSLSCWGFCGAANSMRAFVYDGVTTTFGPYHPGDGAWHQLTVPNVTPAANAAQLWGGVQQEANGAGRVTGFVYQMGATPGDVQPIRPGDDWSAAMRYFQRVKVSLRLAIASAVGQVVTGVLPFKASMVAAPTVTFGTADSTANNGGPSSSAVTADGGQAFISSSAAGDTFWIGPVTLEANP